MNRDKEYFQELIVSVIWWAIVILLCIVMLVILSIPVLLALSTRNLWWLLLYIGYLLGLLMLAVLAGSAKNDKADD